MNSGFEERLPALRESLEQSYFQLYRPYRASAEDFEHLIDTLRQAAGRRDDALRQRDSRDSCWYANEKTVGMMLYVDLFSGKLRSLPDKIPYLKELGITLVHLMPLLKPRSGENDGGYAVEDYRQIDPRLGTMDEFREVIRQFHAADIDICIDYVINHTAREHEWARRALKGEAFYQEMYIMTEDPKIVELYNAMVPEVLPDKCPGNFTWVETIKKYVFTSFSDFQWDLNFKNPMVFEKMSELMIDLANLGVDMIRLDAIPFLWKEIGTACRNLSAIHQLLDLLHQIRDLCCPSVVLLGEAIVEPHQIVSYYGTHDRPECEVMYNASLMVNLWNSLATRSTVMMKMDQGRFWLPPHAVWINYARCHDDIGWGFNEDAARLLGWDPFEHKKFLYRFYAGQTPGSFADGELYQYNPQTQDARTNGTLASLAGLSRARKRHETYEEEDCLRRICLIHAMILSMPGIPMLYSGDEIATVNDQSYLQDPEKQAEGRWVHRPHFDWLRAEQRHTAGTAEYRVFQTLRRMIELRTSHSSFQAWTKTRGIELLNDRLFGFEKEKEGEKTVFLYNFSEYPETCPASLILTPNLEAEDLITGRLLDGAEAQFNLKPYEFLWLTLRTKQ